MLLRASAVQLCVTARLHLPPAPFGSGLPQATPGVIICLCVIVKDPSPPLFHLKPDNTLMAERARSYRTPAVILRRRDYSDADRILTVYTPHLGKLALIAKGIRKTTSRKAGHLELFTHASLQVAKARTWDIITEVVTIESFRRLRQDLDRISQASYVCELVDSFAEEGDENQPLWELLLLALRELDRGEVDGWVLLRWFELHLLSLMGFQPELFHCLNCGDELQPVINYLSLHAGGVYCPRCGEASKDTEPLEANTLKVLRHLQRSPWGKVRQLQLRVETMGAVENVLNRYLLITLERRLKSVDFLRRVRSQRTVDSSND